MKNYFWRDVIDFEWVLNDLNLLDLSEDEKKDLVKLAHEQLHQTILDAILSELSERDKKIFLANVEYDSNESTWRHLNEKVEKVEEKIVRAAEQLKKELKKDLADAKSAK